MAIKYKVGHIFVAKRSLADGGIQQGDLVRIRKITKNNQYGHIMIIERMDGLSLDENNAEFFDLDIVFQRVIVYNKIWRKLCER